MNVNDQVNNIYTDKWWFQDLNHFEKQITDACEQINNDPMLKDGYHAVGFSQGGQFLYFSNYLKF